MRHKYLKDVVTLELDKEKCIGCGMCINVCFHNVFTLEEGESIIYERDNYMECGACSINCPFSAIEVRTWGWLCVRINKRKIKWKWRL